jgi:hypothetical protein
MTSSMSIPMQLMQPYDGKWNTTDTQYYEQNPEAIGDGSTSSSSTGSTSSTSRMLVKMLL